MQLPEFIKRYHNSLPNDMAVLFGETTGDEQDIAHPNAYFMVCFHELMKLQTRVKELDYQIEYLVNQNEYLSNRIKSMEPDFDHTDIV